MLEKISIHQRGLHTRKLGLSRWNVPASVQIEIRRFLSDLELGKVNRGRRISESRQTKYLDVLKVPLEFFNKPTEALTEPDIEAFEKALATGVIQSSLKRRAYAHATKVDIRKALKIFLRWRLGVAEAVRLAGWLDTREQRKTPDFLREDEVERLFQKCRTAEQRFAVAVLFDSGARAEEFLNIRYQDVALPQRGENFVRITLREEFSKTNGRTISLFWTHTLRAVQDFVNERIAEGVKAEEPIFEKHYDSIRMFLARIGKEVLNRPVHPHLFRHSSATHYATRLNRQELWLAIQQQYAGRVYLSRWHGE